MADLAAGGCEIVEALVLVREILDRKHVDRADGAPVAIAGQERLGRQGFGVGMELTEPRQEVGQLHKIADLLGGAAWRSLLDLIGGRGRHGKCDDGSKGSKADRHEFLHGRD
ncbi:hypothetical protein GR328_24325 [Microvirga makkahensis]|uniref:Uncharacterized protein n=1 Tax=Microvirga makkahensis TaxID=1128670 RepID=A0A7X3MWY1_9HYPH|nr:hypothetical protein [Microvirga makkahensis]MXQ14520.1 hypothetical protein [Microvirga makkahensis]